MFQPEEVPIDESDPQSPKCSIKLTTKYCKGQRRVGDGTEEVYHLAADDGSERGRRSDVPRKRIERRGTLQ